MDLVNGYEPYTKSVNLLGDKTVYMSKENDSDILIVVGIDTEFAGDEFAAGDVRYKKVPLTHSNACTLRRLFPFTAPKQVLSNERTAGTGDRLGIACPGHIRVFEEYDAVPVFAQQSIRELTLTGRSYEEVLDCVTFAVYREGFRRGFGADGDHLKKAEELEYALKCGYTMITLDCSEHIRNDISDMTEEEADQEYQVQIADRDLESLYIGREFDIGENVILSFSPDDFKRTVLIYSKAIAFACDIYEKYIRNNAVDFEISIDETVTPTSPLQHYFVANELLRRGVRFETIAPRFCGEFQKGIDYIGDIAEFEQEFAVHAVIARHFGYKISVHSGSDKFSVFPIIGRLTKGRFHLKTAGTNWLEAMKMVAIKDPDLYREIHAYALEVFGQAKAYYHVSTGQEDIQDISEMADDELPLLFMQSAPRQLIHITYGLILNAKLPDGSDRFRGRLYKLWQENANAYSELLYNHIGKHLKLLQM